GQRVGRDEEEWRRRGAEELRLHQLVLQERSAPRRGPHCPPGAVAARLQEAGGQQRDLRLRFRRRSHATGLQGGIGRGPGGPERQGRREGELWLLAVAELSQRPSVSRRCCL